MVLERIEYPGYLSRLLFERLEGSWKKVLKIK